MIEINSIIYILSHCLVLTLGILIGVIINSDIGDQ